MNTTNIRWAILAGVSTDPQVQDKASIPDQLKFCREFIAREGGQEVGCYIMDGYSRSGYESLQDAMHDIPPLGEAVDAADQNHYDVLLVDNWDRLGDLGYLLNARFKKYPKQIHSARQSGRVQDPETYSPYEDDSVETDMHVQGLIQAYRIRKQRRGYEVGMPKRIADGLTPLSTPFAYIHVGPKHPPQLDAARGALVQQWKDMLFAGRTLQNLADYADQSDIAPPRGGKKWDKTTVRNILANPYYAGLVVFRRRKLVYAPHRKKKKKAVIRPRSQWVVGKGRHEALWDEATYHAIVEELDRRYQTHKNFAARYPLSGLLRCSECHDKLWRRHHGHGTTRLQVFSCAHAPAHVILPYTEALDLVGRELVTQLTAHTGVSPDSAQDVDHNQAAIDKLEKERKRIQDGYKAEIFSEADAAREIAAINRQIETIRDRAEHRQTAAALRLEFQAQFEGNLDELPEWIKDDDPQVVNRLLHALCQEIVIHPDRRVEILWRE